MSAVLSLNPNYYEALKRLTLELAGVNLGADHAFLIETRLSGLARSEGFDTLSNMVEELFKSCLLYTSPSPRDRTRSRMPSSA